ncbi:hypothetical protein [Ferruginivarius sediminum]|uniref:hypothetical protein n=1 Tax=Ferruginivarius sediminum TaxID=2661937 RepID=UPI001292F1A9|nr:hypothetical protein [Ferruginivarius sediminum]
MMPDRDKQADLLETVKERRQSYARRWLENASYREALHRYDFDFERDDERTSRIASG